jgi:hypothetical protein
MKPSQLVAQLTKIVAKHTNSNDDWWDAELTDQEHAAIFADLETFIRADFRDWKEGLRKKLKEAGGFSQYEIDKIIEDLWRKS